MTVAAGLAAMSHALGACRPLAAAYGARRAFGTSPWASATFPIHHEPLPRLQTAAVAAPLVAEADARPVPQSLWRPSPKANVIARAAPRPVPSKDAVASLPVSRLRRTGLIAVKRGMTTLFDVHGAAVATTILEVRACQVVRSRWDPQTAQYLVEVGASDGLPVGPNRLSPAQRGHFDRHQCEPKPCLTSFPVDDAAVLPSGTPLTSTHFVPGQYIDVQGTTLGKGFQGAMKRWGFHGQDASHGVSKAHRSLGSTGACQNPGKVWRGKKMAGRMGGVRRTVKNLQVLKIDPRYHLIYVRGHIPGVDNAPVRLTDAIDRQHRGTCFPTDAVVPFPAAPAIAASAETPVPREYAITAPQPGERDPFVQREVARA